MKKEDRSECGILSDQERVNGKNECVTSNAPLVSASTDTVDRLSYVCDRQEEWPKHQYADLRRGYPFVIVA